MPINNDTITIHRKLPIINGYVSVPDKQIEMKNQITSDDVQNEINDVDVIKIGNKVSDRNWVELPEYNFDESPDSDYFQIIRDI